MCGIRTFVSKVPIQLEDLLETADQTALEEQLRSDTQIQVGVERIRVRDERPGSRAAGQGLQHRRLDLEEPAPLQRRAHRPHHRDALPGDGARLGTHDQVDVALPDPRFLAHLLVRDRKRPQCLGDDLPGIGQHRQFAAPGTDDLSVREDDVAEIDVGLPGVQRLLADLGEADHQLQLGAVAVLQGGEAQLARSCGRTPPGRRRRRISPVWVSAGQVRVGGPQFGQRMGARHLHRIGVAPLGEQALTLGLPDPVLLRGVVMIGCIGRRRGWLVNRTHGQPA